jgi:hypothetical protein
MTNPLARRLAAVAGGAAIVAMVGLTAACGGGNKAPETSTTTPTTTSVSPTEKSINPTGGNVFTPTVKAPPPVNPVPGDHNGHSG